MTHRPKRAPFGEGGIPVILEDGRDLPAAPPGMAGAALQLGRHRFGRVVGLAQPGIHARPELGLRPVCLRVVHDLIMMQKHSGRMPLTHSAMYGDESIRVSRLQGQGITFLVHRLPDMSVLRFILVFRTLV
jgi:hypothetical protein